MVRVLRAKDEDSLADDRRGVMAETSVSAQLSITRYVI